MVALFPPIVYFIVDEYSLILVIFLMYLYEIVVKRGGNSIGNIFGGYVNKYFQLIVNLLQNELLLRCFR